MFDWIAFDADDTLWKNEEIYLQGKDVFLDILSGYDIDENELETDDEYVVENIQYYGYGAMSFVLSMIEKAIELIGESIHPKDIQRLIDFGKHMLTAEVEVFDGVPLLLQNLSKDYPLLLITKGDLFHQQRKLEASGLAGYFRLVEVVSEKSPEVYSEILERHQIDPGRFVMIGNSLRSDIIPVLKLGAWAIYLSDHLTWSHEDDPLDVITQDSYLEVKEISGVLQAIKLLGK
ncbi:MAG: HAD family hydrolase [Anaerolineales bacterium]